MPQTGLGPERLAQAAFWYYVQDLNQEEIARRLGVSRSNVSRILRAARDAGIVRFDIRYPLGRDAALEQALLERYQPHGLRDVIVASPTGPEATASDDGGLLEVARACAEWVGAHLQSDQTLALSWGLTIGTIVDVAYYPRKIDARVVQLAGETSLDPRHAGHDLVRDMAARLGGSYSYFNAPAVAPSIKAAKALMATSQVQHALQVARQADFALVGIGSYGAATSRLFLEQAKATPQERSEADEQHAVGQICGRFFGPDGQQLDLSLHQRILSVDLADLRGIGTVVMVAAGQEKARAVNTAMRGGYVDVLMVDQSLAVPARDAR